MGRLTGGFHSSIDTMLSRKIRRADRRRRHVSRPDDRRRSCGPEPIKRMPNRTIASDAARAFLRNPYAVLGESAHLALPIAEFERAREAAGVRFKTLGRRRRDDPRGFSRARV